MVEPATKTLELTPDRPQAQTPQQTPTEAPDPEPQSEDPGLPPELQPNDANFPPFQSPSLGMPSSPQTPHTQQPSTPQAFIWRQKPAVAQNTLEKGKEKLNMESAPITRQGYRSGRLSDNFWDVIDIPGTPSTQKKKLRVLPILTKNFAQTEYLTDNSTQPHSAITSANIAEILAGVPWTTQRARQHIVNETAQALQKVLIFNNQHNTPFQRWDQGLWFAQWDTTSEGEHVCTLYASIAAPEPKIKIRKGRSIGWRNIPEPIQATLSISQAETIREVTDLRNEWQLMTGGRSDKSTNLRQNTPILRNPFSVLREEVEQSS